MDHVLLHDPFFISDDNKGAIRRLLTDLKISNFVEKYAIRKSKKLKNRSKQQGKGDLRLSLSFCL